MKALSIRQPHCEAILRGTKVIEYRSRITHKREKVYLYASQTRNDDELFAMYNIDDDNLLRGVLVGTVTITDCEEHDGLFHWHLNDPRRIEPIKPRGKPQPVFFNPKV
jgi:hypothetical protein